MTAAHKQTARFKESFINAWGNGVTFYDVPMDNDIQSAIRNFRLNFIIAPSQTPVLLSLNQAKSQGILVSWEDQKDE